MSDDEAQGGVSNSAGTMVYYEVVGNYLRVACFRLFLSGFFKYYRNRLFQAKNCSLSSETLVKTSS